MTRMRTLGAILGAVSFLVACAGGAHFANAIPGGTPTQSQLGHIKAVLHVPAKRRQSRRAVRYLQAQQERHRRGLRKPRYISTATTEIDFVLNTVNGTAATAAEQSAFSFTMYTDDASECAAPTKRGGYTCTLTQPAPAGTDTYLLRAQQCSADGSGPTATCTSLGGTLTLLSAQFVTIVVPQGATVPAAFTLSPVVGSIAWAPVTYANTTGPTALASSLWIPNPDGTTAPVENPSPSPGTYTCAAGSDCFEPVRQGTSVAYGVMLDVYDPNGDLIVGAPDGDTIYQTPVYLDPNGNAITISWSCGTSASNAKLHRGARMRPRLTKVADPPLAFTSGGGPYSLNLNAPTANQAFNSPVLNPAADPDGGNTTDANGNPVTAIGNNGTEINWDGVLTPDQGTVYSCSASTSNGLATSPYWYAGPP